MDRRLTPNSGRMALRTLAGAVAGAVNVPLTDGEAGYISVPVTDLCPEPHALRDRQLVFGAGVTVIDRQDGSVFIQADGDGYCGWVDAGAVTVAVGAASAPTHRVHVPATHMYREASIKRGEVMRLSIRSCIRAVAEDDRFVQTADGYIPRQHLRPIDAVDHDPVAVAERLLGTPYLWGGNSCDGIDCSGLVQMALTLCGRPCAGDSDLQRADFGDFLPPDMVPARGDLLFWKGHVAMACDGERLIHANGHTMSVAYEGIMAALARIRAAEGDVFFGMKRP